MDYPSSVSNSLTHVFPKLATKQKTVFSEHLAELQGLDQWAHSRPHTKNPLNSGKGGYAKHNHPIETGSTAEQAHAQATACKGSQGFMYSKSDPFAVVDLDIKHNQKIDKAASKENKKATFYTPEECTTPEQIAAINRLLQRAFALGLPVELSESNGVHIFMRGTVATSDGKGCNREYVETYSHSRYMRVTFNMVSALSFSIDAAGTLSVMATPSNVAAKISDGQIFIDEILAEFFPEKIIKTDTKTEQKKPENLFQDQAQTIAKNYLNLTENDKKLIQKVFSFANGERYRNISEGYFSQYKNLPSHSEARLDVMQVFWKFSDARTNQEKAAQVERIYFSFPLAQQTDKPLETIQGDIVKAKEKIEQDEKKNVTYIDLDACIKTQNARKLAANPNAEIISTETTSKLKSKILESFLGEREPIDFVIKNVIQRRWLYALTAEAGNGKTAIAVHWAICVATGEPIGENTTTQGKVLYFASENPSDVRSRFFMALSTHYGDPHIAEMAVKNIHIIDQSFLLAEKINDLIDIINDIEPALIIVDTDQAISLDDGSEVNNNERMQHAKRLRVLTQCESRPCILVLCHPNGEGATYPKPRGGTAFIGEIDGNLCLKRNDYGDFVLDNHPSKWRGQRVSMTYRMHLEKHELWKDTDGDRVPVPVFLPVSKEELEASINPLAIANTQNRTNAANSGHSEPASDFVKHKNAEAEQAQANKISVLQMKSEHPSMSQKNIAIGLGLLNGKGEPDESKISKIISELTRSKWLKKEGRKKVISEAGKAALEASKNA